MVTWCVSTSQALLKAINNSDGREEIIEASVCALRHLTSRHPSAETARNAVRQQSGIPMLSNFLQQQCRWPLMKALLGINSIILVQYWIGIIRGALSQCLDSTYSIYYFCKGALVY